MSASAVPLSGTAGPTLGAVAQAAVFFAVICFASLAGAQHPDFIDAHLVRYRDPAAPPGERIASLEAALAGYRELIDDHHEDPARPVWQVALAELLLHEKLPVAGRQAAVFYEFGVPREDQRAMVEQAAPEALQALTDAQRRLLQLMRDPSAAPVEVDAHRLGYLMATAAHLTALLQDEAPWFAAIARGNARPEQGRTAQAERQRLLAELALPRLRAILEASARATDPLPIRARLLMARTQIAAGDPAGAIAAVDRLLSTDLRPALDTRLDFMTHLTRAAALSVQGDAAAAVRLLEALERHPLLTLPLGEAPGPVLDRLLLADAWHLALVRRAARGGDAPSPAALDGTYQPYLKLLEDAALGGHAHALGDYLYERFVERLPEDADMGTQPALVVLAAATISRQEAQALVIEAMNAPDEARLERAGGLIDRARQWTAELRQREAVPEPVRLEATYNEAFAWHLAGLIGQSGETARAIELWTELAATAAHHRLGEQGMAMAVGAFHEADARGRASSEVLGAYRDAAAVLWKHYPTTDLADVERLRYAHRVLLPEGRYEEALGLLEEVHPRGERLAQYQSLRLRCYERLVGAGDDRQEIRRRSMQLATQVLQEDEARLAAAGRDERGDILEAIGAAHLLRAELLLREQRYEDALAVLDPLERSFENAPAILARGLEKRLRIELEADWFDRVGATAARMMERFPEEGAAAAQSILFELERRLDQIDGRWLLDPLNPRAAQEARPVAHAAHALAALLRERASALGLTGRDMLPHDVALARALRGRGEFEGATALLEPLREKFPKEADVMHELAEAYLLRGLERGDHELLRTKAAPLYDALITGLAPDERGKRPGMWWRAWTRRLYLMRVTGDYADQISSRVRGLRLTVDGELGGEPYRGALEALEGAPLGGP